MDYDIIVAGNVIPAHGKMVEVTDDGLIKKYVVTPRIEK